MPNEIRPCTLWGKTFDAVNYNRMFKYQDEDTRKFYVELSFMKHWDDKRNECEVRKEYTPPNGASTLYFEAITTIAKALNSPVLATEEVLAGLEYKEVIGYCDAGLQHSGVVGNFAGTWKLNRGSWGLMDFGLEDCGIYKVKAKEDDPKTAEYLRQFTLDGVRIKEGG